MDFKSKFLACYYKNSLLTTYLSSVVVLLFLNLSIKLYQYSCGKIYLGEVVGVENFQITKRNSGRFSSHTRYKTNVFPQKIRYTDSENNVWEYSDVSWHDEIKYAMNEKIYVLETKNKRVYIYKLFSFWLNTTNLIIIFTTSIFLTVLIEHIVGPINKANKQKSLEWDNSFIEKE